MIINSADEYLVSFIIPFSDPKDLRESPVRK
jgi:hypothetical protein